MQAPQREEITFTREQFYEKVWSAPAKKIAKELGLSDVMIGKICKSYDVPKPYLGYWAQLEHGKKPRRMPLPKNSDPELQSFTLCRYPERETTVGDPAPEPVYDPDIQQLLDRARALEPVKVAEALRNPHPLVAATRDQIKADQIPFSERPIDERYDRRPTLSVKVSKENLTRALRIMDALLKRVGEIGGRVEVRKEKWHEHRFQTVVYFGGEEVTAIRLREKLSQVRVPPGQKKYNWSSDRELRPSGLLMFDRGPSYIDSILLRDTPKRRRSEEGLNDLIIGLVRQAGDLRIRRREEEAARKRREEEERIRRENEAKLRRQREELAQRQQAEQARVDQLVNHANAWRQSQIIRDYLAAVCDMLLERDGAIEVGGEAAEYLRWAHQQANRLDPLRQSPPSVLDERL